MKKVLVLLILLVINYMGCSKTIYEYKESDLKGNYKLLEKEVAIGNSKEVFIPLKFNENIVEGYIYNNKNIHEYKKYEVNSLGEVENKEGLIPIEDIRKLNEIDLEFKNNEEYKSFINSKAYVEYTDEIIQNAIEEGKEYSKEFISRYFRQFHSLENELIIQTQYINTDYPNELVVINKITGEKTVLYNYKEDKVYLEKYYPDNNVMLLNSKTNYKLGYYNNGEFDEIMTLNKYLEEDTIQEIDIIFNEDGDEFFLSERITEYNFDIIESYYCFYKISGGK